MCSHCWQLCRSSCRIFYLLVLVVMHTQLQQKRCSVGMVPVTFLLLFVGHLHVFGSAISGVL